jgi:hypothetical protein
MVRRMSPTTPSNAFKNVSQNTMGNYDREGDFIIGYKILLI